VVGSKYRSLEIAQTSENKYVLTLKVFPKSENSIPSEESPPIASQIELNPEDMLMMNKFLDKWLDELLNI
jgi:hypothetical protein